MPISNTVVIALVSSATVLKFAYELMKSVMTPYTLSENNRLGVC